MMGPPDPASNHGLDGSTMEPRVAYLNDHARNQQLIETRRYAENVIVTSKYTVASFIPKTIFEFFRVVANIYFLLISLLQLATPWSPTNRFTTAGPLLFVLLVTMLKQGSEDLKRHTADDKQNNQTCTVVAEDGGVETITWKQLKVGQLLLVRNGDELPADIVILATSEDEGRCFIETSNLDGETNLKRRVAVSAAASATGLRGLSDPAIEEPTVCKGACRLVGRVEYEQPNNQLYNFTGRLLLAASPTDMATPAPSPIGPENIMLRGCGLRSCAFVVGIVIFTGAETKLLQNSRAAPSKQSKLYKTANACMTLIFVTMFVLCIISAVVAAVWSHQNDIGVWYLPFVTAHQIDDFFVNFFMFLILYNNLVPISLYVSLDIIKVIQARMITADDALMDEVDGVSFRAISRTSDLNEELGQVEYVFSDKTGTLTRNIMEFRKCLIGGQTYGFGTTEIGRAIAALQPSNKSNTTSPSANSTAKLDVSIERTDAIANSSSSKHHALLRSDPVAAQVHYDPMIHFDDPSLLLHLAQGGEQSARINEFLTLLAVCHTVIPEPDRKTGVVQYRASSPDEEALVKAAKCLGYNFVAPAPLTKVEVTCKPVGVSNARPAGPELKTFTTLNVNEFNSTRKRMSVVCMNAQSEYVLYCKGADNMMLPRCLSDVHTSLVLDQLRGFANEGLRTLVLARRVLSEHEYNSYNARYLAAASALTNREALLDAAAESIECEMTLVGVTAIEDKLQEGVPQAIYDLAQAGIKIWVLTGDREETAINIGHACRLINDAMKLVYVNMETLPELEQQIEDLHSAPEIQELIEEKQVAPELAMVCDGKALVHVFPSRDVLAQMDADGIARRRVLAAKLLDVASVCKALIACRVSPSQKADIVNLVRKGTSPQPITLAIGDGANDVSMIQTAHLGIGICGKEGVQAVNASDYAIAQFRFLARLLLHHGRFNYKRICKVIRYSFHKNIALVISLFLFNFFNGQSGSPLFESFVMAGWNFFLATPIIVIGVFDQDLPDGTVEEYPQLYHAGQHDSDLNRRTFAQSILNAVVHALICFWVCMLCVNHTTGLFVGGTLFYVALLATMKLKVVSLAMRWTRYHVLFLAFSVWLFFFFIVVYPLMTFMSYDMFGATSVLLQDPMFWHFWLVVPVAAMLVDATLRAMQNQWVPTCEDILREKWALRQQKQTLVQNTQGQAAYSEPSGSNSNNSNNSNSNNNSGSSGRRTDVIKPADSTPGGCNSDESAMLSRVPIAVMATPSRGGSSGRFTGSFKLTDGKLELVDADANHGFAFNVPEMNVNGAHGQDLQEVVTMRVHSFNAARQHHLKEQVARDSVSSATGN